jgi:DNA-binding NtrC family response regulator
MRAKRQPNASGGAVPILVVDDDAEVREMLAVFLGQSGFRVTTAASGVEALQIFSRGRFPLVVSDLKMPAMDGMQLLTAIMLRDERTAVILITAHGSIEKAVEAVKQGAYDFITKPVRLAVLDGVVRRALERHLLAGRIQTLHAAILALLVSIPIALVLGMALARRLP